MSYYDGIIFTIGILLLLLKFKKFFFLWLKISLPFINSRSMSICQSATIPVKIKKQKFNICTGGTNHRQSWEHILYFFAWLWYCKYKDNVLNTEQNWNIFSSPIAQASGGSEAIVCRQIKFPVTAVWSKSWLLQNLAKLSLLQGRTNVW